MDRDVVLAIGRTFGDWPLPAIPRGTPSDAVCSVCSRPSSPVWPSLPSEFTQWGVCGIDPTRPLLCADCTRAFVGRKPIQWGHVRVRDGVAEMSTAPEELRRWLDAPLGDDAVLCQTNRQKRSLLAATKGHVATCHDGVSIQWTATDATRLEQAERLRWHHGFSEPALTEPAPRPSVLVASPDPADALDLWHATRDRHALWWEVALLATRRTKGGDAMAAEDTGRGGNAG